MPFFGLGPLLLIAIVVGVVMFIMRRTPTTERGSLGPTAREILDRRYAAGELSKEQYEQMKRDLA
ncbi:MAG TPA: SHOCT domain-containing protein [Roseiarcus sp.]|nr:SHOCT domain-containing protein [Roseiarcus sp.]